MLRRPLEPGRQGVSHAASTLSTPYGSGAAGRAELMREANNSPVRFTQLWRTDRRGEPRPPQIRQVRGGSTSRQVVTPVPRVYLSGTLAAPTHSDGADATRLCQGCSRPPGRLPGQAALSFTAPRYGSGRDGGLSPPSEQQAAHGAPSRRRARTTRRRSRGPSTPGTRWTRSTHRSRLRKIVCSAGAATPITSRTRIVKGH
jgi:hypothetical protein